MSDWMMGKGGGGGGGAVSSKGLPGVCNKDVGLEEEEDDWEGKVLVEER